VHAFEDFEVIVWLAWFQGVQAIAGLVKGQVRQGIVNCDYWDEVKAVLYMEIQKCIEVS